MLTPMHLLNAFSEPRPGRTLELVEASKVFRVGCEFNLLVEHISLNKVIEGDVQPRQEKLN